MKFFIKNKFVLALSFIAAFSFLLSSFTYAATTPTPVLCPDKRVTSVQPTADINSSVCVECQLFDRCPTTVNGNGSPQGGIDLTRFFPTISLNDMIGTIATILLAFIVIFFIFKVIVAGYKWANNDAQDKSKKEAIKSITNGVTGIVIAFAAYFVVLFARSVFGLGGTETLVNCSNVYFENYNDIVQVGSFPESPEVFQRCIKLAGKDDVLNKANGSANNFRALISAVNNDCKNYFTPALANSSNPNPVVVDRQKLNDCFVQKLNNLP